MAITAEQLTQVARVALASAGVREAVATLRNTLPGLRVSSVDAFDMRDEEPALRIGPCNLFLMESDGHCWSVTRDPAQALGIVLTQNG